MNIKDKILKRIPRLRLGVRAKITAGLCSICAILLASGIISVLEYRNMSNYVSGLIADNVKSINAAQKLSEEASTYNLGILAAIGEDTSGALPDFDKEGFLSRCDSLKASLAAIGAVPLTDSVLYAYSAYMLVSLELPQVMESDFIDTRSWYFGRLQPIYLRLNGYIDRMSSAIYGDLRANSERFDRGFYRSVIPGVIAVGVGLMLVLLLLYFILVYYVNPLYGMLRGLADYRSYNHRYSYGFDGDDQLAELNDGITELANENFQLRRRISNLKGANSADGHISK